MMNSTQPRIELSDDLIREILLKLPVKTLVRFKQVSKTWLDMITSHEFILAHYYNSTAESQPAGRKNPKSVFIMRTAIDERKIERFITIMSLTHDQLPENLYLPYIGEQLPDIDEQDYTWPSMFSAGLGLYCIFKFCTPEVALWNPGTRKMKVLPPSPFSHYKERDYVMGFGNAEFKNDRLSYKIGLISVSSQDRHNFELELYSSTTNSWKLLICDDSRYERHWNRDGVNFKGIFHLLSKPFAFDPYIITFDYNSEVFGRMEIPALPPISGRRYDINHFHLTLYDDKLCFIIYSTIKEEVPGVGQDNMLFDVWVMHEYGIKESWSKEFTVGPYNRKRDVLYYENSNGGMFLATELDSGTKLCLCNYASSVVTKLLVSSPLSEEMCILEYMESLVSMGGTSDKSQSYQQPSVSHQDPPFSQDPPVSTRSQLFVSQMGKYFKKLYICA